MIEITAPCATDVSASAGTHVQPAADWLIIDHTKGTRVGVKKPDGTWLCKVLRRGIPERLCKLAEECYLQVGKNVSTNRGFAAGATKRSHTYTTFEKGMPANSGIMGFMDSPNMTHPCRLTQFSRDHFEQYQKGLPFIQHMDRCLQQLMPDAHSRQRNVATQNGFHIQDTAFSTITVNYNFQTALHIDSGDFRQGFGTLALCQRDCEGGWILFPGFKTAIVIQHGDFIAMDVHEWHCNTPIIATQPNGYRLSFVGYLREKMIHCDEVNRRIEMAGSQLTSARMLANIFEGDDTVQTTNIGTGPQGHQWWQKEGRRFVVTYKFKRYVIFDKTTNTKYLRLTKAWEAIQNEKA